MHHVKRHMDMASSSMGSMASMTHSMMDMASSTMGSMSTSTGMDMDHDHGMDMELMHMYFTTQYKNYPVLFKTLTASNKGQAFGIFLLLFVVGFLTRGIEFVRNYLELVVWKNPTYVECHPGQETLTPVGSRSDCCGPVQTNKLSSDSEVAAEVTTNQTSPSLSFASSLFRNAIRLALCILPDLFGFALMLAAMSYTLTYFFAVVLGLGVGRFVFERLSDRMNLKPLGSTFHC